MSTMQFGGNGQQTEVPQHEGVESVKIEKNSRGWNYSYRVVKRDGEGWTDVLARIDRLEAELQKRFGGE